MPLVEQALGYAHGAKVVHAPEPVHGRLRYCYVLLQDFGSHWCIFFLIYLVMTTWKYAL